MLEQVISNKAGWTRVAFGDVVRLSKLRAKDPEAEGYERVVGLEHIDPGDLRIRRWADIADGTTFTSVFKPGQVLFGKRRAYQRKVAVADFEGVCSGDIYVLEPSSDALMPALLPFICHTDAFFDHAVRTSVGSLSPRTNWTSLAGFQFMLPPLQEQARLLSLLEASEDLVNRLDNTTHEAEKILLATRHSLMSQFSPDLNGLPNGLAELGLKTTTKRLIDLVVKPYGLVDGPFGSNLKSEHYKDAGYPVVQSAFIASGKFNPKATDWVYVNEEKFQEQRRSAVSSGEIVMVKVGINCGECGIYPDQMPQGILAGNCLKLAPDATICETRFLLHYMKWLLDSGLMERHVTSTQQRALTLGRLKEQGVFLPSLSIQEEISAKLDSCDEAITELRSRKINAVSLQKLITEALLA